MAADLDPIVAELARARRAAGYTLRDVADRAGIAHMTVGRGETGQVSTQLHSLRRWADALGYALVLIPRTPPEAADG